MKKVKIKAYAKINLTLDVIGKENNLHLINSIVSSVSLYDLITVKKRKDRKVTLKCKGLSCQIENEKNNAYVTALKFVENFNVTGADVVINKKIPVGAGLGGSSADIVGVILAMCKLYNVEPDCPKLLSFAKGLGSDVLAMMNTGYKIVRGTGDKVGEIDTDLKLYFLLLPLDIGVSSKDCYRVFDEFNIKSKNATGQALVFLTENDKERFLDSLSNDLIPASVYLLEEIQYNLNLLSDYGKCLMTGSGSTTYLVFSDKKERDDKYKMLKSQKLRTIKADTV